MENFRKLSRIYHIKLDTDHRLALRKNRPINLRNKEYALLEFFMRNCGRVLTRDLIMEKVWDRNALNGSNTVDVHINRLRRKLDDPFREKLIHTVHCLGYMFEKRPIKKQKQRKA